MKTPRIHVVVVAGGSPAVELANLLDQIGVALLDASRGERRPYVREIGDGGPAPCDHEPLRQMGNSDTIDPFPLRPAASDRDGTTAVIEILFHSDLARIGQRYDLGPATEGSSVVVGRDAPLFTPDRVEGSEPRPLGDPCISRRQLTVAWSPWRSMFQLASGEGRRSVRALDGKGDELCVPPADVPPGTLVAIGDRVLLLLTLRRAAAPAEDLGLWGHGDEMDHLRQRIAAVASLGDTVLVRGETGVGKELVARAIHACSERRSKPFLALNCAAVPEGLIESELFGHVRGAFSGADVARPGMFAAAEGGTLLLDEIGEMPLPLQAKLLRVLELRRVRPVGGRAEDPIDVCLIAATNRDLLSEVAAGRFRADLYSRIEAPQLLVPPLSQRRTDVPLLFARFLQRRTLEHARASAVSVADTPYAPLWREPDAYPPAVGLEQMLWLIAHPWPRNVRELDKMTAEVAAALVQGEPIPIPRRTAHLAAAPPASEKEPASNARPDRARLEALLERNDFNQADVARALGVPYATLDRWLRELAIPRPKDLSLADIDAARREHGGDLVQTARALRVSLRGLKARLGDASGRESDG
jgi:DNA-binding NtrC family response regulator